MNHIYQPSGKISLLFWPAAVAMLVVTVSAALLCTYGIQVSHATLLDMMIFFTITKYIAKLGALLCIKFGRVRKPAFARGVGIALALWYWLFLLAFHAPVKAALTAENSVWIWKWSGAWKEALAQYVRDAFGTAGQPWRWMLLEPVLSLKENGAVITGKSGNTLFTVPGLVCAALLAILLLGTVWQFGFALWEQGRAPFFEASGKWAKKTVVNLKCPTEETFLSRLLLGDTTVLADLEPPGIEDADSYFKVSVFAIDGGESFYVSVSKMITSKKQRSSRFAVHSDHQSKRRKKQVFEEEQVAEYLVMDRGTGFSLLRRADAGCI